MLTPCLPVSSPDPPTARFTQRLIAQGLVPSAASTVTGRCGGHGTIVQGPRSEREETFIHVDTLPVDHARRGGCSLPKLPLTRKHRAFRAR